MTTTTTIQIEKNVPMPAIEKNVPMPMKQAKEDWKSVADALEIGDSIFVPISPDEDFQTRRIYVWQTIRNARPGIELVSRRSDGGVRIWRSK